jgi:hypothetical protein
METATNVFANIETPRHDRVKLTVAFPKIAFQFEMSLARLKENRPRHDKKIASVMGESVDGASYAIEVLLSIYEKLKKEGLEKADLNQITELAGYALICKMSDDRLFRISSSGGGHILMVGDEGGDFQSFIKPDQYDQTVLSLSKSGCVLKQVQRGSAEERELLKSGFRDWVL